MKNPSPSLWMSAANSTADAMRGFWTSELRRNQATMAREAARAASGDGPKRKAAPRKRKAR